MEVGVRVGSPVPSPQPLPSNRTGSYLQSHHQQPGVKLGNWMGASVAEWAEPAGPTSSVRLRMTPPWAPANHRERS